MKSLIGLLALGAMYFFPSPVQAQFFALQEQYPFPWITDTTTLIARPAITDIDGDGDLDIFVGTDLGKFRFYESTNNVPGSRRYERSSEVYPFNLRLERDVYFPTFTDIDRDGDMDLLAGDSAGNFLYYQNAGSAINPSFQAVQYNPFGLRKLAQEMFFPASADMDGDGDQDLWVGNAEGVLYYFENTGSAQLPSYAAPVANAFNLDTIPSYAAPVPGDFDNDGDIDMILGGRNGALYYLENDGDEQFADYNPLIMNPIVKGEVQAPLLPTAVDMDRDGDLDLVIISMNNQIFYYENVTAGSLSVDDDHPAFQVLIGPNPARSYIEIQTNEILKSVEIRTLQGEEMLQIDQPEKQIFVGKLPPNTYIIEFVNVRDEIVLKRFERSDN